MPKRTGKEIPCSNCGKMIYRAPSQIKNQKNHYCDFDCLAEHRSKTWKGKNSHNYNKAKCRCHECGDTFYRGRSYVKGKVRVFCSRDCYNEWQRGKPKKGKLIGGSKERVKCSCANCGKTLYRARHRIRNAENQYCDKACLGEHRKQIFKGEGNPWYTERTEVPCKNCGIILKRRPVVLEQYGGNAFCNQSCLLEWRSKKFTGEGNPRYVEKITVPCEVCGKEHERVPSNIETRQYYYCSTECRIEGLHIYPKGEKPYKYYGPNWLKQRARTRKRDKNTCQECGITKQEIGRNLDVHHIIPFREFGYIEGENDNYKEANKLDNLIALCPSCHHTLEPIESPWWGNGNHSG